jgi:hypothetical protein
MSFPFWSMSIYDLKVTLEGLHRFEKRQVQETLVTDINKIFKKELEDRFMKENFSFKKSQKIRFHFQPL